MTFIVYGRPVPKARPRVVSRGGKTRAYTPSKTTRHERTIATAALAAGVRRIEGRVLVTIVFTGLSPKADIDNAAKAVLDALNGIAYADDRQVRGLTALCREDGPPRTEIAVGPLGTRVEVETR